MNFTIKLTPPKRSDIYDVLWQFALKRQQIYLARCKGVCRPWTTDRVLTEFKFTNAYRAADRTSQYLIRMAYSEPNVDKRTLFLRVLLFKVFNKIATWENIVDRFGVPTADSFDFLACNHYLSDLRRRGASIYSGAYIMPSGGQSSQEKHSMHLSLIENMLKSGLADKIYTAKNLSTVYDLLRGCPSLGPFLAFQYAIDLNYTTFTDHSEMEFVVAGPGALDGLSKCFSSLGDFTPEDTIRWMTERQDQEFLRLGLAFSGLWGRPLQLIDVQNLLCEISKYTRVSHPETKGCAGRTRIKTRFTPTGTIMRPFFPPKWDINQHVNVLPSKDVSTQFCLNFQPYVKGSDLVSPVI